MRVLLGTAGVASQVIPVLSQRLRLYTVMPRHARMGSTYHGS